MTDDTMMKTETFSVDAETHSGNCVIAKESQNPLFKTQEEEDEGVQMTRPSLKRTNCKPSSPRQRIILTYLMTLKGADVSIFLISLSLQPTMTEKSCSKQVTFLIKMKQFGLVLV